MESLLRLSGLLSEDDGGKTDLATLERRLADRYLANGGNAVRNSSSNAGQPREDEKSTMSQGSQPVDSQSDPQMTDTSPKPQKEQGTDVEALSEMMCSLVTNNCGETRFLGMVHFPFPPVVFFFFFFFLY